MRHAHAKRQTHNDIYMPLSTPDQCLVQDYILSRIIFSGIPPILMVTRIGRIKRIDTDYLRQI